MKIYSTNAQERFAAALARRFRIKLSGGVGCYPDGQVFVALEDLPQKEDVIVVGNTFGPVQYEELRLLIHTIKDQNVKRVIVVIPYFGAGRQDIAKYEGSDVAAKMHAEEISARGPEWVLLMDIHQRGIIHFFKDPVKVRELSAQPVLLPQIKKLRLKNFVCVAPDVGRFGLIQWYAKNLGVEAVALDKRREGPGRAAVYHVVGEVASKDVVLIDDIIDSGATVYEGARVLKAAGARRVHLFATHLVLSGESHLRFQRDNGVFASLHGTDTINQQGKGHGFQIHSVVGLFADYIRKVVL